MPPKYICTLYNQKLGESVKGAPKGSKRGAYASAIKNANFRFLSGFHTLADDLFNQIMQDWRPKRSGVGTARMDVSDPSGFCVEVERVEDGRSLGRASACTAGASLSYFNQVLGIHPYD